jgi:hypothetical protein
MGVAVKSGQLHDVATTLKRRTRSVGGTAVHDTSQAAQVAGAQQAGCQADSVGASSSDGDSSADEGSQVESEDDACEWGNSEGEGESGSDAGASSHEEEAAEERVQEEGDGDEHSQDGAHDAGAHAHGGGADSGAGQPQSVEGFYDAKAVSRPRLSVFGVAWRLLNTWVCPTTVLHLHARPPPSRAFAERTLQVCPLLPHRTLSVLLRCCPEAALLALSLLWLHPWRCVVARLQVSTGHSPAWSGLCVSLPGSSRGLCDDDVSIAVCSCRGRGRFAGFSCPGCPL